MSTAKGLQSKGFSLLEATVGTAIAAVILAVLGQLFFTQVEFFSTQTALVRMQESAKIGAELVSRELRMAGYDPTATAGAGILEATANAVRFTMDVNGDGDVGDSGEDIKYAMLDGDSDGEIELGRSTDGGATYERVVEPIQALRLYYTLEDGTRTDSPGVGVEIRKIEVEVEGKAHEVEIDNVKSVGTVRLRNVLLAGSQ